MDIKNEQKIKIVDVEVHLKVMKKAFEELGITLKDAYYKNLINDMDEDKDGTVTFEEFEKTLRRCLDLMHRARAGQLIIPDFPSFTDELKQVRIILKI